MPLVKIQTSAQVGADRNDDILRAVSHCVAEVTRKPETYTMVFLETGEAFMAGKPGPAAFVDVRAIGGLTAEVNKRLSEKLCETLEAELSVPADRTYITFTDVPATNWGWDRRTFG